MSMRPGGVFASRPLHFIWIVDGSGSMSLDGKIQALNTAIREAIPHMQEVADDNPNAEVLVRAVRFSHGAEWHIATPTPVADFRWSDLAADPLQSAGTDVVFLMDTTGSMGPYIDGLTETCAQFAANVAAARLDVQLGLVGFGDLPRGERMSLFPLTPDVASFQHHVRTIPRTDGYDEPESSLDAVREGLRFGFRASAQKVLVLITDASPHEPDQGGYRWSEIARMARDQGALVYCIAPDLAPWRGLPHETGGAWFPIADGRRFLSIIDDLGRSVATEVTKRLASGATSAGTDLGAAYALVTEALKIPPMENRALPPVLVLVSDGQPTDDAAAGLKTLMAQGWGKKAVRIAVAIGKDVDLEVLQQFIGHTELVPLQANSPEALVARIKWASTAVLKAASAPASRASDDPSTHHVPIPTPVPDVTGPATADDVW